MTENTYDKIVDDFTKSFSAWLSHRSTQKDQGPLTQEEVKAIAEEVVVPLVITELTECTHAQSQSFLREVSAKNELSKLSNRIADMDAVNTMLKREYQHMRHRVDSESERVEHYRVKWQDAEAENRSLRAANEEMQKVVTEKSKKTWVDSFLKRWVGTAK